MSAEIIVGNEDFWNPEVFCPQQTIRAKSNALIPFHLNSPQRLLSGFVRRCYAENKWFVHVKPRQYGSSTFFACLAYQHTAYRSSCRTAIIAHRAATAKTLARIAIRFHRHDPSASRPEKQMGLKTSLHFPVLDSLMTTHSVRDEDPLRGDTVSFLLASEIASWRQRNSDDAWAAARSAVPEDYGFLVAEGTPKCDGDALQGVWDEAAQPYSKWLRCFIPWVMVEEYSVDPPRGWAVPSDVRTYADRWGLTEAQAFWMQTVGLPKCKMKISVFQSEYPISDAECWTVRGESMFDTDALLTRLHDLTGGTGTVMEQAEAVCWADADPTHRYVITCDPAGSWAQKDYFGVEVLDLDTCEQVFEYRGHAKAFQVARALVNLQRRYNDAVIYVEANGLGESVLSHLEAMGAHKVFHRYEPGAHRGKPGWWSSASYKAKAISILQELISDGSIVLYSTRAIRQLLQYRGQWDGFSDEREEGGGHFDLVPALAMAAWAWAKEHGRLTGRRAMTDKERVDAAWKRLLHEVHPEAGGYLTPWGVHW